MPKHAVISWMATLNRLPTKDGMKKWGIEVDEECILCKEGKESRDHMFFTCRFSKSIWKRVLTLCGLQREVLSWVEELNWAIKKLKGKSLISKVLMINWNAYIYYIWRERNCRLFKHKEETEKQILEHMKISVKHRLTGLRNLASDSVNFSLCSS